MSTIKVEVDTTEAKKKLAALSDEVGDIETRIKGLFVLVDELRARVKAAEAEGEGQGMKRPTKRGAIPGLQASPGRTRRPLMLYCECAIGQWRQDVDHGRPHDYCPNLAHSPCRSTGLISMADAKRLRMFAWRDAHAPPNPDDAKGYTFSTVD